MRAYVLLACCVASGCVLDAQASPASTHEALSDGALLVLNEVLANEPDSDTAGEFVEIVNRGSTAADLTGVTLGTGGVTRHVFASGTQLAAGQALVVMGGARGIPSGVRAVAASSGTLVLSNGGSTVILSHGASELDRVTYTSSLSGTDGVSMNRTPDGEAGASFVLHTRLASAQASPGTRADGSAFGDDEAEPPPTTPEPPEDELSLRIVAANLTSGTEQSYDPGHGIRILQGLRPDIALVQEANHRTDSDADLRSFVTETFGASFRYVRQSGVSIPNAIVSRFPIVESGVWDDPTLTDRDHMYARIDIPGDRDLWAVSVHFPGSTAALRTQSATALAARIASVVPVRDYLVIGGDLNTDGRNEACVTRLAPHVRTAAPYPVDQQGKDGTNAARKKPYDWLLVDTDLAALAVPVRIGASSFASGLVFDSRVFSPLSAVSPVQSGDSAAANMQHMAVVRDFFLESGE